jgi:D-alanyl-D-alanine carboxypeptidase/D-alanyl-D-alanine-endopeptidase (penicillin-binding protein 4)
VPSITPSPTPIASPTPAPTQTLEFLQSKISSRLFSPEARRGRVGIKIVSLNTGKVVFENESEKYFIPASNMKNFTVATAMEKLGSDFRFVTRVFAAAMPDANGTIKGDMRILGGGDVSISTAFFGTTPSDPETYYKGIDRLVDKIAAAGVKRIEGNIVGDESYFKGFYIPQTWEWDDLQWYYGAEVSALPINDNAVDISVKPTKELGACAVTISPPNTLFQVVNNCLTTSILQSQRPLAINKRIDRNIVEVSGAIAPNDKGFAGSITVTRPAELFVALLKQRLGKRGIGVKGGSKL